jgi:WD40 repeat protein
MIHDSPSHLYCSALKLSPSSSWLHQYYNVGLSQEVKVVKGFSAGWGTCFRTVLLNRGLLALTYWKDTIAVSSESNGIITLNASTGSKIAVLSGHTDWVKSLTLLQDGTSLVSGSYDKTIKLWDMQTGGVVKTLWGHAGRVFSVSTTADYTTIASGSDDKTIRLWDIQTGECHSIIQQESGVHSVHFFPLDPQHLLSISGGKVWEWGIDGYKIAHKHRGSHVAFSFDGTKFVLCNQAVVQVHNSDSGVVVAKFHIENTETCHCCFSPDGKFVAIAAGHTAYVWNITNSEPYLIETFTGHTKNITSLVFSSPTSLVSASQDRSVKFWQIDTSSKSPDVTNPKYIPHTSPIQSITLQAKDGIATSSDSHGVVRTWDLSTGLCRASFQTPAKGSCLRDTKLIGERLVLVWYAAEKIYIWDAGRGELLQTVDAPWEIVKDLRISEDGSKVFCMESNFIHAWYIWAEKAMGKVKMCSPWYRDTFLTIENSKVWVKFPDQGIMGWDFGVPDSSSIKHHTRPPNRPHLDFVGGIRKERSRLPGIEDTITGKEF